MTEREYNSLHTGDIVKYNDRKWIIWDINRYSVTLSDSSLIVLRLIKEDAIKEVEFVSYGVFNPIGYSFISFDKCVSEFETREREILRRRNSKQKAYNLMYSITKDNKTKHKHLVVVGRNMCRARRKLKRYIERVLKPDSYKISKKEIVRYILL
jgi:hypothetical protein|nr:MAG TPA: hypothetical protein [Caudoviricetes sp.]